VEKNHKQISKAILSGFYDAEVDIGFATWCFIFLVIGPTVFFVSLASLLSGQDFWGPLIMMAVSLPVIVLTYRYATKVKRTHKFVHEDWRRSFMVFYYLAPFVGLLFGVIVYSLNKGWI
jgi:hypothetical protein